MNEHLKRSAMRRLAPVKRPLVDVHSFELAKHFLADISGATEDDRWELAEAIQTAVEDWFTDDGRGGMPEFVGQNRNLVLK